MAPGGASRGAACGCPFGAERTNSRGAVCACPGLIPGQGGGAEPCRGMLGQPCRVGKQTVQAMNADCCVLKAPF